MLFGLFERSKAYEDLNSVEFEQKIMSDKSAAILDVRTFPEFRSGYIKGAQNIDVLRPGFETMISKLNKDKTYYVYCRSGNRSGQACKIMATQGYRVYNLAGGLNSWAGDLVG